MQINVKSLLFAVSLTANGIFILLFVLLLVTASKSKNFNLSIFAPDNQYIAAAAVASAPRGREIVFNAVEITLKPREKAFLQFSFVSEKKQQANLAVTALYDQAVIAVARTGWGIEITALAEGYTVVQILAHDGIKDIALITITDE
jgi:hypothetical protein